MRLRDVRFILNSAALQLLCPDRSEAGLQPNDSSAQTCHRATHFRHLMHQFLSLKPQFRS